MRREPDPGDRRQTFVTLTDEGLKRATRVFGTVSNTENALLGWLGDEALGRMNDDLRELLLMLEGPAAPGP